VSAPEGAPPGSAAKPLLVLGSSSPRRRDLLATVGLRYEVLVPDIDERPRPGEAPRAYTLRNATEKAAGVAALLAPRAAALPHGALIVSADTIVVLDDAILEKPRDIDHARAMLANLSGRAHTVISGVALRHVLVPNPREVVFAVTTTVRMKRLSAAEIAAYVRTGEPLDKAGGYGAQGIGSYMVEAIEGSYTNVVGLPVAEVVASLERDFGYSLWA
jgi:septum formation protein